MRTRILVFALFSIWFFAPYKVFSQKWDSIPGKLQNSSSARVMYADSNYLYVAGRISMVGGVHAKGIARWNGHQWDSLGAGIDGLDTLNAFPQNTLAITQYNHDLYVGGVFSSLGKVRAPCIGTWNGTVWNSIPIQPFVNSYDYSVDAMTVINNKLYVGGIFDTVAGFPCVGITQWNDSNWNSLDFPNLLNFDQIDAICEYNGSIYIAGIFYGNTPGDTISNILRWDGKNWLSVGGGVKGSLTDIASMIVYNGELYVAGYFFESDGNAGNYIQRWNGTAWNDVEGGTGGANGQISQLLLFNSKLYAVGVFTTAGGIPADKIASWDGAQWCSLEGKFDNTIVSGCVYKDSLYIGGGFWTIDGDSISYLAKWAGGSYTDSCSVTGINDVKTENREVKVFPNPNNGVFNFQLQGINEKTDLEIYNMMGEKIYNSGINSLSTQIDLSNQPAGIYLYRIVSETGEQIATGKLVIKE